VLDARTAAHAVFNETELLIARHGNLAPVQKTGSIEKDSPLALAHERANLGLHRTAFLCFGSDLVASVTRIVRLFTIRYEIVN
jgi:hypothetical protein